MKLKICGMKYETNIKRISSLLPDYMGFIFYDKSPRYVDRVIPKIDPRISKVGVFVNHSEKFVIRKSHVLHLDYVQLHGNETPQFCQNIMNESIGVIKSFSIGNKFDFSILKSYESSCDYFLFDTLGTQPGGTGIKFDWSLLLDYPYEKFFFLSGGISSDNIAEIIILVDKQLPIHAIDINSKFELSPGKKDFEKVKKFKSAINAI